MRFDAKHFVVRLSGCAAVIAGFAATSSIAIAGGMDYTPSLDIIPTATFATGQDEKAIPGPGNNPFQDPSIKFNFIFTQPIAKKLTLQLQQNRTAGYDVTLGSAVIGGQTVYPGSINDIFEEARLNYTATKNVNVVLGDNYRWRECCPNAAQNGNATSTQWHGQYVELDLTSPSIKPLNGTTFTFITHAVYNHWHNSPAYQAYEADNGIPVNGGTARFPTWFGLNATVPINSGVSIYGLYGVGAFDYFDNTIAPYYYDLADFGLTKSISKNFTFIASIDSLSQQHLERDNPFPLPNAIHRAYFAAALDIHLAK